MNKTLLALAAAALFPMAAVAAEPTGWTGTGEFGLAIAKGNTDTQTAVGKLGIKNDDGVWKLAAGAAFLYGKNTGVRNAQRYEMFGNVGRRVTDRSYVFGAVRNERDRFGTYEYQWTASAGYGYEAIRTEATQLTFEVGPGFRWAKLQGVRRHENGAIVRGMVDFRHAFNASTSLYDNLVIEAGSGNTFIRNDAGVMVKMSDSLALKAGVEVRHNTDVQPGRKKTDTLTTINVVYGF